MPGTKTYYNNWLNLTTKEFWLNYEGDTGATSVQVADYFAQIYWRLVGAGGDYYRYSNGPFNGLTVETWNRDRSDMPNVGSSNLKNYGGLTPNWENKMYVNSACGDLKGTYSHEFGHHYAYWSGVFNDLLPSQVGYDLYKTFERLRLQDTTNRTNLVERFAEDFKFFFGADGVVGVRNPQDDAALNGKRWPDQVPGLKFFIKGMFPVYNHLKDRQYTNFQYYDAGEFWWKLGGVWQKYAGDGWFYYWSGTSWVKY